MTTWKGAEIDHSHDQIPSRGSRGSNRIDVAVLGRRLHQHPVGHTVSLWYVRHQYYGIFFDWIHRDSFRGKSALEPELAVFDGRRVSRRVQHLLVL